MSREEAKAILVKLGVAEPTAEQITEYLNSMNGEIQKEKDRVEAYKEKAKKVDELQAELDGIKEKDMTEAQKAAKELETAQAQIAELRRGTVLSEVKAVLAQAGLAEEDYKDFVAGLVTDDVETSKAMASALVASISKNADNAVKKYEKDTLDGTGKPDGGDGSGADGTKKTEAEKTAETIGKTASETAKAANDVLSAYTS